VTYVTFAEALSYAESIGMRLPIEEEYEFAATAGGTQSFPWGEEKNLIGHWEFGPAGEPRFDHTNTNPPVYGLYSNVAEWTDSRRASPSGMRLPLELRIPLLQARVVRGGPYSVTSRIPIDDPDRDFGLRFGHPISQNSLLPGVGFRCARSVSPRFLE
jgi:formylglycine-generating enzyme required for sulfatase activity